MVGSRQVYFCVIIQNKMISLALTPLIAYMTGLNKRPPQQHKVVVEKSTRDSGGKYTLLYIEAAPGVYNPMQYHKKLSKTFEVLEGSVTVEMDGVKKTLAKGDRLSIRPGVPHRIYSNTANVSKMYAMVMPGHQGYEDFVGVQFNPEVHGTDYETMKDTYIRADSYRELDIKY
jgi:quercetin dioxygenase-like cupin family protein